MAATTTMIATAIRTTTTVIKNYVASYATRKVAARGNTLKKNERTPKLNSRPSS
jgi:hypothetical protein